MPPHVWSTSCEVCRKLCAFTREVSGVFPPEPTGFLTVFIKIWSLHVCCPQSLGFFCVSLLPRIIHHWGSPFSVISITDEGADCLDCNLASRETDQSRQFCPGREQRGPSWQHNAPWREALITMTRERAQPHHEARTNPDETSEGLQTRSQETTATPSGLRQPAPHTSF